MPLLVEFPGVDKVLPDAVKTSGYRADRSHPSVAEPYQETVVLLTERLPGCDGVGEFTGIVLVSAYPTSDPPSGNKLNNSAYQGDDADKDRCPDGYSAIDQRLGG